MPDPASRRIPWPGIFAEGVVRILRVAVLAGCVISLLVGCYSRTTLVPPVPPTIEGQLAAVTLYDGEQVSLGTMNVELTGAALVIFDASGSEIRRIPRDDIREVEIVEFRTMRTVLFAVGVVYPLAVLVALASSGSSPG